MRDRIIAGVWRRFVFFSLKPRNMTAAIQKLIYNEFCYFWTAVVLFHGFYSQGIRQGGFPPRESQQPHGLRLPGNTIWSLYRCAAWRRSR